MIKPKILFMGTSGFALPALSLLVEQNYPLGGVVTQPDRPQGRGRILRPSPIKAFALAHHLPILQPERVRNNDFLNTFRLLSPDMVVLAAFGQILPKEIIDGPKMGCLNIHPSLLPRYRGAAPINWAIIHGEQKTGVTIIQMAQDLDTGDIIMQQETAISADETFDQLHDRLASLGAELLIKAIEMTVKGTAVRKAQDGTKATYAPMLKKENGLIHWDWDVDSIVNLIRGLASSPGAYTFLEGKMLKVFGAKGEKTVTGKPPGTVTRREETSLLVSAGNGYVHLQDLQIESKKRMNVKDFMRGYQVRAGSVLG